MVDPQDPSGTGGGGGVPPPPANPNCNPCENGNHRNGNDVEGKKDSFKPASVRPRPRVRNALSKSDVGVHPDNYRSSLQTIEGSVATAQSGDDENDYDAASSLRDSSLRSVDSHTSGASGVDLSPSAVGRSNPKNPFNRHRRQTIADCVGVSKESLMVSFSNLNEHELANMRKWNRRLQRTEVFDKYYFPAKWEESEMNALVRFLNLEDPSTKLVGGLRGGSLRGSGSKGNLRQSMNGSSLSNSTGGRRQRRNSPTARDGGLSSSFTAMLNGAGIANLLPNPDVDVDVDPVKETKRALNFIFFPFVHDPKSVLLKRGSVLLHSGGGGLSNEIELMIFTHGFVMATVTLEDAIRLFLALSDRAFLTERSFLDFLRTRFQNLDYGGTGEIEKWELQKLFVDLGMPMGESVIDELIKKSSSSVISTQSDKVEWRAIHKSLQDYFTKTNDESLIRRSNSGQSLDQDNEPQGMKKLFRSSSKKKITKVERAMLFSSVARVDSLDICHGDHHACIEVSKSEYAETSFSVTLNGKKNDPIIFVCSKQEHRDSWVEAFKPVLVRATMKSSVDEKEELRSLLGWQHLVVRSSFLSLVIMNDIEGLKRIISSEEGGNCHKRKNELNAIDEHNGYSALHYATILSHTDCMGVLLEAGASVSLEDREGKSPMYHALNLRNDEVANVLEKFGADRSDDLRKLIGEEIALEEMKQADAVENGPGDPHFEYSSQSSQHSHEQHSLCCELSQSTPGRDTDLSVRSGEDINELLLQAASMFGG